MFAASYNNAPSGSYNTEWIIDEYRENWYLDESSVEYKFRHSYIYHNTGKIPLRTTYSTI